MTLSQNGRYRPSRQFSGEDGRLSGIGTDQKFRTCDDRPNPVSR